MSKQIEEIICHIRANENHKNKKDYQELRSSIKMQILKEIARLKATDQYGRKQTAKKGQHDLIDKEVNKLYVQYNELNNLRQSEEAKYIYLETLGPIEIR